MTDKKPEIIYFNEERIFEVGAQLNLDEKPPLIFFIGSSISCQQQEQLYALIEKLGAKKLEERFEHEHKPGRPVYFGGPSEQYRDTFSENGFVSYYFENIPNLAILVGGDATYQCPEYRGRFGNVTNPYISIANYALNSEPIEEIKERMKKEPEREKLEERLKTEIINFFTEKPKPA